MYCSALPRLAVLIGISMTPILASPNQTSMLWTLFFIIVAACAPTPSPRVASPAAIRSLNSSTSR